jgi:hypothetical protein
MEIYNKLKAARNKIKESDLKKLGHNNHSNYDYYTPEQVGILVSDVCNEFNLLRLFDLKRNELGYYGEVKLINLDNSEEVIIFTQATDIPKITASNIAQQIGGSVTYTSRYMDMTIFDIKDNDMDFDTPKKEQEPKQKPKERVLTASEVNNQWNGKIYKNDIVYISNEAVKVNEEQLLKLKEHDKYKPNNKIK